MDKLISNERSKQMGRVRNKHTKPELIVRSIVDAMGNRYRLHSNSWPCNPDMVFPKHKKIIFVRVCFWHQHYEKPCRLTRLPKSRKEFWEPKLQGNYLRDIEKQRELKELGWKIIVIWECQLKDKGEIKIIIKDFFTHEIN